MTLRIAGLQHAGVPGAVEKNLRTVETAARRAAARGARLLITPEMFVTGYNIGDSVNTLARADIEESLAAIARRTRTALVVGLPLAAPSSIGVTNSVLFLDHDGVRRARYDKTHLFGQLDKAMFVQGETLPQVVDFEGVRLSFLICYDVEFPETVRAAAQDGAELLIVPTAQMEPFAFVADHLLRVRAWENQVHIAYINRRGSEGDLHYVGRSSIVDPSGAVLDAAGADETALLIADIDGATVRAAQREKPHLTDLRHDLYPVPFPHRKATP